jgi:multidrug efflux pump subunit AcrB
VLSHTAYVSDGGPRFYLALSPIDPDAHAAFVLINIKPGGDHKRVVHHIRDYLLAHFPKVRPEVKQLSLGTGETGIVKIRLIGPNADNLFQAAERVKSGFRAIPGTIDIKQDWGNLTRKVIVRVDQNRARRAGVTSEEIAYSLNDFLSGSSVTNFRQEDVSIPVMLRALESERFNLDRVRTINVYSASRGTNVPLLQISDFELHWQYGQIKRRDLERTVTVSAKHPTYFASELLDRILPTLDDLDLPAGFRVEIGGEVEDAARAQAALFYYLPHCLIAIILLLIWQFNSVRKPLIIALTIPLAMIGGVVGLLITGSPFSFTSTLGFLSLAGIIINNAIVLIDRINLELEAEASLYEAVVTAAVKRLRPILMTTLTTVLGLLPLIFFGGDLWFGMANVIAFGLAMGTVMTLGAVPVLYTILYKTPIRQSTTSGEVAGS